MNTGHTSGIKSIIRIAGVLLLVLMSFAVSGSAHAFPEVHVVSFFENANPTDSVSATQDSNSPEPLTLLQNLVPSFSNVGYTFEGWNTLANGSGTLYADGANYSFGADIGVYAQWSPVPEVHVVTFFENADQSDLVAAAENGITTQSLTLLQNLNPSFSNVGYTFVGWNTLANGSGTSYVDGSAFAFNTDLSLYAQWAPIPVVHVATFFENDSTSDSVSSYLSESAPTPLTAFGSLQPVFTNPGHSFSGWNTSADGSGISYADGSTYSFGADISLFAQWVATAVVSTVTFKENVGASDSIDAFLSENTPSPLTTFVNLQPTFTNPGHRFSGWNTLADGSGVSYADGAVYSFSRDLILYAQWQAVASVHTVTFMENDSATDNVNIIMSDSTTSPLTNFSDLNPKFQNGSLPFADWNTSPDGTGTSYSDGSQFAFSSNLILFAQWTEPTIETFSFRANGGSGAVTPISGSSGSTIVMPDQSGLIRAGFVLKSWNSNADGSGAKYLVGQKVTITESLVLYAEWSGHKLPTLFGAIGTFKNGSSSLSSALKSQINRVAVTIKSRKYATVDLFGYSAATGLKSLNISLSRSRASNVAIYLRNRLHALKVRGVRISSSGEGSIAGQSSNAYSRVEVFGV